MAEPSWELSTNIWAHGYLKFLDFQSGGFDLHVTFMKSKAAHVSVYEVGSTTTVKLGQQNMITGVSGLSLEGSKRLLVKNVVSPSAAIEDSFWTFLEDRGTTKATELNFFAPQTPSLAQSAPITTATVTKGGSSGVTVGSTWGDKFRQNQYGSAFPVLSVKK